MRIRWRGLELPTKVELNKNVSNSTYGSISVEPFERGFGITVGNSLRRILLSSLEGSAVTAMKIHGATHEFTSIPGVMEDVTDIVLNVKSLILKLDVDEPRTIKISKSKAGVIRASDIDTGSAVTIINTDQIIATLTKDIDFQMELTVEKGRGYKPASEATKDRDKELGVIPIDAVFSPVVRVRYKTEETRVGQLINYDRLIIEIWTNGTVTPEMALVESAKILRKHLGPFIQYFELGEQLAPKDEKELVSVKEEAAIDEELQKKMSMPIQDLELSVRAANCLEAAKIETVGQLVAFQESELLALRSFGKTSLREVKRKLADIGLLLGMNTGKSSKES